MGEATPTRLEATIPAMPPELLALRRKFASELDAQLAGIRDLHRHLSPATWVRNELETLHRKVHNLTGSAGTFGMPALSNASRLLEAELSALLKTTSEPDTGTWQTIGVQIDSLQSLDVSDPVEMMVPEPPLAEPVRQGISPLVHLGVGDAALSKRLEQHLVEAGYRVRSFAHLADLRGAHVDQSAIEADRPVAVALDSSLMDSEAERDSFLAEFDLGKGKRIPVVMALAKDDLEARLRAMRAGVNRTLTGPLQPGCLIESLDAFTSRQSGQAWRVLMVDDDPLLLEAHAAMLRAAGMQVRTLADPLKTLDVVQCFKPDVLLLDVYMPQLNGPELAAALRERDAQLHLPILFLSAETDMTQQLLALNLGGDDFLIKPVVPEHLVAAVNARARRAQQIKGVQTRLETTLYERQREHLALDHHAIVTIADQYGNLTYANEKFCKVSGYSQEELQGSSHHMFKSDQHPRGFVREVWETIRQGKVWHGEMCSRRKDGSNFWAETSVTPFLDTQGAIYQYISIQTDISHIKEAEAALRRQHDMQRMTNVAAASLMAAPISATGETIEAALRHSAEQLCADRADLFGFSEDGDLMRNLYSWNSTNGSVYDHKLQQTLIEEAPWMREQFLTNDMIVIPDVAAMPPEADEDRRLLEGHQVRALLVIPLHVNGRLSGCLSYSSSQPHPEWTPQYLGLLKVLTEVVGSAMGRRRSEQALRDSESRLNFLVSSSPATIYTCETRAPFGATYISPNVQQLLGFQASAFLKDHQFWADLVHPEDRALFFEELSHLFSRGSLQHEYRSRTQDGGYKWIHTEMLLVRNEAGQPVEVIGYAIDITERKSIEQELFAFNHELEQRVAEQTQSVIESERISRATLDAMSARVIILEESGVILAANQAWRAFRQAEAEPGAQVEGLDYLEHCDRMCNTGATDGIAIAKGIRDVISGEKQTFLHEYGSHLPHEQRWFLCRVEPFPGDGAVRVVVSHENITQMKLIERQQMRSQRLESLGTLAGGVAHDLNNALAPILMGMGILKDQYPEENKLIDMIHNSAKRGADMVRQLLTFAKGADGQRIVLQPAHLMLELEHLMKGSFPKNIDIQMTTETGLPSVVGDATQLHQILLNLSVNARDAMPNGGLLTMEAKSVEIDEIYARSVIDAKPGKYVCLRVSDNGDGIPAHVLDHIFDPFFSTKSQDKGTGLGLSTVLGIVKGHGGFVQVHSTPGKGTTFTVYLPASLSQSVSEEVRQVPLMFKGQGECILFVDDEQALREVGQTVLERLNFSPVVARDGIDGLVKATEHRTALKAIITDIHMPNMDGLAFVQAVRRVLPDIPIILASGRVDESIAKDFRELGVTARLDKPFTEVQLAEMLRPLLQQTVH